MGAKGDATTTTGRHRTSIGKPVTTPAGHPEVIAGQSVPVRQPGFRPVRSRSPFDPAPS